MDKVVEWIKNSVELCSKINNMSSEKYKEQKFTRIKQSFENFTDIEKQKIFSIMDESFEKQDLIYVYSVFNKYTTIKQFDEKLLCLCQQMDYNCLVGSIIEMQISRKVGGTYSQRRQLRNKNVCAYSSELSCDYPYISVENRNKNRIILFTEQILSEKHSPTTVLLNYVYTLQKYMGYEVLVFACPTSIGLPSEIWYENDHMNYVPEFNQQKIKKKYKDIIVSGYQICMNDLCLKEYNMMLDLVYAWNPLFVLDVGTTNPIVELTGRFTSLVSQRLTYGLPISNAEILMLPENFNVPDEDIKYAEELGQKIYKINRMRGYYSPSDKKYSRSQLGLPEDKYIISIVGNRLDQEIDEEFRSLMTDVLTKEPNVVFAIIGNVDKLKQYFSSEEFQDKIYYLGMADDLIGWYQVIDLYINPRRIGGGFSAGMALAAGVPVITLADCDVAFNVGDDFVVNDFLEMAENISKYCHDQDYIEQQKMLVQEHNENWTEEKMYLNIKERIEDIISLVEGK